MRVSNRVVVSSYIPRGGFPPACLFFRVVIAEQASPCGKQQNASMHWGWHFHGINVTAVIH
jgi:hypothetical protein